MILLACGLGPMSVVSLTDLERFPGTEEVKQALAQNQKQQDYCLGWMRLQAHRRQEWEEALADVKRRSLAWYDLEQAQRCCAETDYEDPLALEQQRLEWLEALREKLGEDDYRAGRMPDPVLPNPN